MIGPEVTLASSFKMVILSTGVAMCCSKRMHKAPENVSFSNGKAWTLAQMRDRQATCAAGGV